jgi:hypothetical protein
MKDASFCGRFPQFYREVPCEDCNWFEWQLNVSNTCFLLACIRLLSWVKGVRLGEDLKSVI